MNKKFWNRTFFCIVIFISIVFINAAQICAQEHKWYAGAGIGASEIESNVVLWTVLFTSYLEHEERDLAYKFFGGYQINDYLGIELSYLDFGKIRITGNSNTLMTAEGVVWRFTQDNTILESQVSTISLGVVISLPLDKITKRKYLKQITPYFKLGAHYWDLDKSLTPANSVDYYSMQLPTMNPYNPTNHSIESDCGLDWFYGAGLSFNVHKRFSIILGYEWYNFQENMAEDTDFVFSSVVIKF